jgi:hypothetical protein
MMRRVERVAWNAIVRCTRAKKLTSIPLPIPVEEWVEGPLNIRLTVTDLSHEGPNTLGLARIAEREIEVSHILSDQDARFRFTVAHELGHVLLHGRVAPNFRDSWDADVVDNRIEREAERFAAAFLMPIPSLCAEFTSAASDAGTNPHTLLAGVTRGDERFRLTFRRVVIPRLTRRFGVSVPAALFRFSDVQLPDGEPAIPFKIGQSFLSTDQPKDFLFQQ